MSNNNIKTGTTKATETTEAKAARPAGTKLLAARLAKHLEAEQKARTSVLEAVAPAFASTISSEEKELAAAAHAFLGRKARTLPDLTTPVHVDHERIKMMAEQEEIPFDAMSAVLHAKARRSRVVRHIDTSAQEIGLSRFGEFLASIPRDGE